MTLTNSRVLYRGQEYTILSEPDHPDTALVDARNSRGQDVLLLLKIDDGKITWAALRHSPWERVQHLPPVTDQTESVEVLSLPFGTAVLISNESTPYRLLDELTDTGPATVLVEPWVGNGLARNVPAAKITHAWDNTPRYRRRPHHTPRPGWRRLAKVTGGEQ